jgi:hypothetical protein
LEELIEKRRNELLTPEEHTELLRLTAEMEKLDAQRVEALSLLATVRKTTLSRLMQQLGIPVHSHE